MSCDLTKRFVPGYLDGELDLVRVIEFEAHIKGCAECDRELENQRAVRSALRRGELAYAAPAELRRRIVTALGDSAANGSSPSRFHWPTLRIFQWAATFAVLAVCVVALPGFVAGLRGRWADQRIAAEVFTDHVRSLEANHLLDVASTDQHTVKPWFDGKLDFSPPVEDLADDEFPLIGGRLDYLEGREVAALVYQRRKHFINVFVWPDASGPSPAQTIEPRQGYNMLRWSSGGFQFWAVSDVSAADLAEFVRLLEARLTPSSK